MEKKGKARKWVGEEDSYILRYPLLDSKANTPTLKKTIPGPAFFPISLNDIFLMKSYITPNSSTFGLISNTAKALDTPSKDGWLWPLLWSEQSVNGLINWGVALLCSQGQLLPTHKSPYSDNMLINIGRDLNLGAKELRQRKIAGFALYVPSLFLLKRPHFSQGIHLTSVHMQAKDPLVAT